MSIGVSRVAYESLRILPRKRLSRWLGQLADTAVGPSALKPVIAAYANLYGVDLSEAEIPARGFQSFDEFFTRRLREGLRPLPKDPWAVASPADARIEDKGVIRTNGELEIKGATYKLRELLGGDARFEDYVGGRFWVLYLSPRDYHRVHTPVTGTVERVLFVPGTLYPVNKLGLNYVPQLFARNERVAVFQNSEMHGKVATIMVGAMGVGGLELCFGDLGPRLTGVGRAWDFNASSSKLTRGDELGVFHMGSTVILCVSAVGDWTEPTSTRSTIRVGEEVATLKIAEGRV